MLSRRSFFTIAAIGNSRTHRRKWGPRCNSPSWVAARLIWITTLTANNRPARLLRNDNGNQNDMLRVKLVGTRSNRDGIGAKVTLTTNAGARLFRMVKTGSSYASQSELPLTFGLGKPEPGRTVGLEIVWPSGQKDSLSKIGVNQFITVKEGSGITSAQPIAFDKAAS